MPAPILAQARVSGHRSQQLFDVMLRTLAEPGTVRRLPISFDGLDIPPALWLALALADVDTPVHIAGDTITSDGGGRWAEIVAGATDAPIVDVSSARIVVALSTDLDLLEQIAVGTATAPEDGARLAVAVTGLHAEARDGTQRIALSGPGLPGTRRLGIDGLDHDVIDRLGQAGATFPAGFDTWLFTGAGRGAAVPRSTTVEREGN